MAEGELAGYIEKCQQVYGRAINDMKNMTGWTIVTEREDITVSSMGTEDSSFLSFKVEVFFNKPPSVVARYMYDNWEALNKEFQPDDLPTFDVIKQYNENAKTTYTVITPPKPVSPRLSLCVYLFLDIGDNTYTQVGCSVDMPDVEVPKGHVLDDMTMGVHLHEPVAGDETRCHTVAIYHIDPKGSIPSFIFNGLIKRRHETYEKLLERINSL